MEAMRQSWTDDRLDDGFARVEADLRAIRGEVSSFRVETSARFDRLEKRFDRFDDRFDRWQRMMFSMFGGLMIALLGIVLSNM
jgi:hypothetical protein